MMIQEYISDLAMQMGIKSPVVSVIEGIPLGCLDVNLLQLSVNGNKVDTLIFKEDLERLNNKRPTDRLEVKLRTTLSRLQIMLEP